MPRLDRSKLVRRHHVGAKYLAEVQAGLTPEEQKRRAEVEERNNIREQKIISTKLHQFDEEQKQRAERAGRKQRERMELEARHSLQQVEART